MPLPLRAVRDRRHSATAPYSRAQAASRRTQTGESEPDGLIDTRDQTATQTSCQLRAAAFVDGSRTPALLHQSKRDNQHPA